MQKISSYLYPNRSEIYLNLDPTSSEWQIVYQRKIKLYQGLDNVIEFDIKNSQQKRVNIASSRFKFVLMNQISEFIYDADLNVNTGITGIANVTIPSSVLAPVAAPQFLKYIVYKINNDGTKVPVYGDTQFGVTGVIDFIGNVMPSDKPPMIIDTFIYMDDDKNPSNIVRSFYSEAVEIRPTDPVDTSIINIEFRPNQLTATVTVQVTDDTVVSAATTWRDLETFTINPTTDRVFKTYSEIIDYSNNVSWLRVMYVPSHGVEATFDVVTDQGIYYVTLNRAGHSYRVGSELLILGSQIGGDDGIDDITITVTAINSSPFGGIQRSGFTFIGVAELNSSDPTEYNNIPATTKSTAGKFDKIIVRM